MMSSEVVAGQRLGKKAEIYRGKKKERKLIVGVDKKFLSFIFFSSVIK